MINMKKISEKLKGLGLTDATIKTYVSVLRAFFIHIKKVKGFSDREISDYLEYLITVKNYSGRSRNLVMKVIKMYCREFLSYEPEIKKAKEDKPIPRMCEDNEFRLILSVTPLIKHRLCLLLMRYSGLRRWEVIRVMKHHIQEDGRLFVKAGKGKKDRYTIVPEPILKDLRAYISLLPVDNPYIFQGVNRLYYSTRTPGAILINAFKKLGWHKSKWFGCHALRHACTIHWVEDMKIDFDIVSKMLGHSLMRTTQIYMQCRKLNLNDAIRKYKEIDCLIH